MYSYSNSVFISEPNTFVFVFGFYFWTEYIRIRIRFLFLNRIYSYSYSVYISKPNSIRIQWKIENLYSFLCRWDWLYKAYFFSDDDFNIFEPKYISRKEKAIINLDLFVWLFKCIINLSTREDAQSHWLHFLVFSYVSSNGLSDRMHSCIRCICLAFLLCVFSNVHSKLLHTKIYNHTDCICVTFLHCGFSNVHSNCLPVRI